MNNQLQILEWDSSFFGYPVAKITASSITVEEITSLTSEARAKKIRLVYLFTDPTDQISNQSANATGAKLVDSKITFQIPVDPSVVLTVDDHIEQIESGYPSKQLISLSIQSGLYSRYKIDPNFINNEFERMYLAWIENSVNKKIADHTFVYMEDGLELGFVTVKVRDSFGQIGLIAVDETSRGKSIGKKLVHAVIDLLVRQNIPELEVATQKNNADACNFYEKVGFKGMKEENIYHIWL